MFSKTFLAWFLIALCVTIHAGGMTGALQALRRQPTTELGFWRSTWLFIRVAARVILLHLLEITVWAAAFLWQGAMPDLATAFYFSAVTYTTTGYGDVLLPPEWRLVGAVEALTGILMCGWSTGFFFALVSRLQWGPQANAGGERVAPLDTETR